MMPGYMPDQNLPFEHEVERAIIGALMLSGDNTPIAAQRLKSTDFQNPYHQHIFQACVDVWADGVSIDCFSVFDRLRKDGHDRDITLKSLGVFTERVASDIHLPTWCAILKDYSRRRAMTETGLMLTRSLDPTSTPDEILARATQDIYEASDGDDRDEVNMSEVWHDILNTDREPPPIPMGMGELDTLCGLAQGSLTIVGAAPGAGKTVFALNVALNLAEHGRRVWFVSIEMKAKHLVLRTQSVFSGIDGVRVFRNDLSEDERDRLAAMHKDIHDVCSRIQVDNRGEMDTQRFMAAADRKVKSEKVDLIVVDYIQLITADPKLKSEYERVTAVSQCLRRTARVLNVPILGLSQLRRREGAAAATMHDLKSTGQMEADAGLIILLNPTEGGLSADVVKNRNGMCRSVILPYQPECYRVGPRAYNAMRQAPTPRSYTEPRRDETPF